MSFVSIEFSAFIVITAVIYFALPANLQWKFLLVVSAIFYYLNASLYQVFTLVIFLGVNYIMAIVMSRAGDAKHKKLCLILTLTFDIAYLLVLKYIPALKLSYLAPVGISYIALIVIGYMIDLYWENISVQRNIGKFALFACFFPHVISGPIVKYKEYENNLFDVKHSFSYDRVMSGVERIIWGVFKKLVISSRAAVIANNIHDNYFVYTGFYVPIGVTFYIIQLYMDFSGLMDIVIGVSEVLGIEMPENFNTPFYSQSISEFWRRWHITLGRFLKDYVLFPMQMSPWFRKLRKSYKNIVGKEFEKKYNLPRYLTMLISWALIGLWHGCGMNYLFGVGIYMWIVIILGEILQPAFEKVVSVLKINTECESWTLFRRIRTFFLYMFGVSFFWMDSMKDGMLLWKNAFYEFNPWVFFDKSIYELGLVKDEFRILTFGMLLVFIVSFIQQKESVRERLNRQNYLFRVLVYMTLLVLTILWGYYGEGFDAANFIYGQF